MQVLSAFPDRPRPAPAVQVAASVAEALRPPQAQPVPVAEYAGAIIRRGMWNNLAGDGSETGDAA
jgi:hypothetical protein